MSPTTAEPAPREALATAAMASLVGSLEDEHEVSLGIHDPAEPGPERRPEWHRL